MKWYNSLSSLVAMWKTGGIKSDSRSSSARMAFPLLTSLRTVWPQALVSARKSTDDMILVVVSLGEQEEGQDEGICKRDEKMK